MPNPKRELYIGLLYWNLTGPNVPSENSGLALLESHTGPNVPSENFGLALLESHTGSYVPSKNFVLGFLEISRRTERPKKDLSIDLIEVSCNLNLKASELLIRSTRAFARFARYCWGTDANKEQ